jgi:hydroxymethylpyrimidine pyrophosphatase-like HAD family hydrolase
MLEKAGISLTVANAPSDVKDVCDYVSPYSFGEGFVDGVRWLVERGFIDDVVGLF